VFAENIGVPTDREHDKEDTRAPKLSLSHFPGLLIKEAPLTGMKIYSNDLIAMRVYRVFVACLFISAYTPMAPAATNDAGQTALALAAAYLAALPQPQPPASVSGITNSVAPVAEPPAATNFTASLPPDGDTIRLGIGANYWRTYGGDYTSLSELRISLEARSGEHHGFSAFVLAGALALEDGSRADRAVHMPLLLGWGVGYRYYFTRKHTFVRPYVAAEATFLWMYWDYKDDVVSSGNTCGSDSVEGAGAYLGAGVLVGSSKVLSVFGEIGAGGVTFLGTTHCDLKNDLFDSFGYVGVKAGVTFWF
jgi:hypothetical protein